LNCFPNIHSANNIQFTYPEDNQKLSQEQKSGCRIQIQRNLKPGMYSQSDTPPLGISSDQQYRSLDGELSILHQYELAIKNAKQYIYIENQHMAYAPLLNLLQDALKRGIIVIYVAPGGLALEYIPLFLAKCVHWVLRRRFTRMLLWCIDRFHRILCPDHFHTGKTSPYASAFLQVLPAFTQYSNFLLAGIGNYPQKSNEFTSIYVHSKLMIIDDIWYTIGSANLVDLSLIGNHTELNATVWDQKSATQLRCDLFEEHLNLDVTKMDPIKACSSFKSVAIENRKLLEKSKKINCKVYKMNPKEYGTILFLISAGLEFIANRGSRKKLIGTLGLFFFFIFLIIFFIYRFVKWLL